METAFKNALAGAGVHCDVFFYGNQYSRRHFSKDENAAIEKVNLDFINLVTRKHAELPYQLIFFCACDDYILPITLKELKKLSIPLVNYQPDMALLWFRVLRTGKLFDLVACAQTNHLGALRSRGINAQFVPFGAHPALSVSNVALPFYSGIRYLGSPFPDRARILGRLLAKGLPLDIHGHHWFWFPRKKTTPNTIKTMQNGFAFPTPQPRDLYNLYHYLLPRLREEPMLFAKLVKKYFKRHVKKTPFDTEGFYGHIPPEYIHGEYADTDFGDLVRSAAVNIGFSHLHPFDEIANPGYQMRLRDMEIPMAGGFYLAEYSPDMLHCFEPAKHIEIWHTEEELADKAAHYLAHAGKASKIASDGMLHAQTNHTWAHRFNQIFGLLGLKHTLPIV